MSSAIEKHVPGVDVDWTRERVELVKRTVCPQGITDAEFALFIEQCKRSGMDPLLKEAFCVKRRQNIGSKEQPRWVEKHEFQPSESGFIARAERMPDFKGIFAQAVYAEDQCAIDPASGLVEHRFMPTKKRGVLLGAWARVERAGRTALVVWLDLLAYQQNGGKWRDMPATMIEKCARVGALRKAYPSAFSGIYIPEEMTDNGEVIGSTAVATTAPKLEEEKAKLAAVLQPAQEMKQPEVVDAELVPESKPAEVVKFDKPVKLKGRAVADAMAAFAEQNGLAPKAAGDWCRSKGLTKVTNLCETDLEEFKKWALDAPAPEAAQV